MCVCVCTDSFCVCVCKPQICDCLQVLHPLSCDEDYSLGKLFPSNCPVFPNAQNSGAMAMQRFNLLVNRLSAEFKGTEPVVGFSCGEILILIRRVKHLGSGCIFRKWSGRVILQMRSMMITRLTQHTLQCCQHILECRNYSMGVSPGGNFQCFSKFG